MKFVFTERALGDYDKLSPQQRSLFHKQVAHLLQSLHYPSLHAKKYNAEEDIWQGRVNGSYRFYFQIHKDTYIILSIVKHPK